MPQRQGGCPSPLRVLARACVPVWGTGVGLTREAPHLQRATFLVRTSMCVACAEVVLPARLRPPTPCCPPVPCAVPGLPAENRQACISAGLACPEPRTLTPEPCGHVCVQAQLMAAAREGAQDKSTLQLTQVCGTGNREDNAMVQCLLTKRCWQCACLHLSPPAPSARHVLYAVALTPALAPLLRRRRLRLCACMYAGHANRPSSTTELWR